MVIVKLCEPKREDSFVILARYIQRDHDERENGQLFEDDFATLSRYMTREESFPAVATNCGVREHDIDGAIQVIRDTQALNTRAKKKTMHLVVSFPANEYPTDEQLAIIEERLARSLAMERLQRIRVVHTDTNYPHMHIAISRIDPVSHRSIQPSRDFERLQREAAHLEIDLGLTRCTGRGVRYPDLELQARLRDSKERIHTAIENSKSWDTLQRELEELRVRIEPRRSGAVFVDLDMDVSIAGSSIDSAFSRKSLERDLGPLPAELERPQPNRSELPASDDIDDRISDVALRLQRRRGIAAFQTWALERREELSSVVAKATSWDEVQDQLAQYDVALVRYRQGLSLVNLRGKGAVAASKIDRAMSKQALEDRIGPFEPSRHVDALESEERPRTDASRHGYEERPYEQTNDSLFGTYLRDLETLRDRAMDSRERSLSHRDAVYAHHAAVFKREARSIRHSFFLDAAGKRRAYERLSQRRKTRYQQIRIQTRSPPNHIPSYRQWLLSRAMKGDTRSLEALSSLSSRFNEPTAWHIASKGHVASENEHQRQRGRPNAVFRDGSTEISREGVPLIDDGQRLHCTGDDLESVRALLLAAQDRYTTPLEIDGGEEFMTSVAICAIEMDSLTFADRALQERVNQLRQHRRSTQTLEQEYSRGLER